MFTYAEVYGGKVRDVRTSNMDYVKFCSIWDPCTFWVDVTGVEGVQKGWIVKSNSEVGVYFEAPAVPTEKTVDSVKAGALEYLNEKFTEAGNKAFIVSSLGFRANAGQRAKSDVNGLIELLEDTPEATDDFMDYDNVTQTVTLSDLKTLRKEIILNGKHLYKTKWRYRTAIEQSITIEEIEALMVTIVFTNLSFITGEPIEE